MITEVPEFVVSKTPFRHCTTHTIPLTGERLPRHHHHRPRGPCDDEECMTFRLSVWRT